MRSGELESFLIEITAIIFGKKDEDGETYLVDKVLDKTGMKGEVACSRGVGVRACVWLTSYVAGFPLFCFLCVSTPHPGTGRWTIQEAAERSIAASTMSAALDMRYISGKLEDRKLASTVLTGPVDMPPVDRAQLVDDVRQALYAAKICSYTQGMNLIREAAKQKDWTVNLGECARIWKGGCIIRAKFLDRITQVCVGVAVSLSLRLGVCVSVCLSVILPFCHSVSFFLVSGFLFARSWHVPHAPVMIGPRLVFPRRTSATPACPPCSWTRSLRRK